MKTRLVVVAMLITVLVSSIAIPVRACSETVCDAPPQNIPDCKLSPLNPVVKAPAYLIFDGSMSNAYEYVWKMDGDAGFESKFEHLYEFPGTYDLKLFVYDSDGNWNLCRTSVVVEPSDIITMPTPEPMVNTPISNNTTSTSTSKSTNTTETKKKLTVSGNIEGNDNFAPVINGDNNTITFTTSSDSHNTDSDDHSSVVPSVEQKIQEPVKTTPKSFFWMIVKSILDWFVGPTNSWIEWIVINK